jgi:hypothetical protein
MLELGYCPTRPNTRPKSKTETQEECTMIKLSEGQATGIVAMIQKRDQLNADIQELVDLYATRYGLEGKVNLQAQPDGLYLVVYKPEEDQQQED